MKIGIGIGISALRQGLGPAAPQAPTGLALDNADIDENNSIGDVIGTFVVTDPDDAIGPWSIELVNGTGDTDNNSFTVDPDTNQLLAAEVFDFETKSSYAIRARVVDLDGEAFEQALTVDINDLSDSPATHRYWRVLVTANQSGDLSSVTELQMHETSYGPDVCNGGTALSDSDFSGSFAKENAFNDTLGDDNSSRWASANSSPPHYIGYDFGSGNGKLIEEISFFDPMEAFASQGFKDISIQYSDNGSAWTTYWSVAGLVATSLGFHRLTRVAGTAEYTGSPHGTHQHWRINISDTLEDGGLGLPAVAELEFRSTPGGSDEANGGTPAAKDTYAGDPVTFAVSKAFDNDNSTKWAGNTDASSGGSWVRYAFTGALAIAEVAWKSRGDAFPENAIKQGAIAYADSSSGPWTFSWGIPVQSTWSLGEQRLFTDPAYGTFPAAATDISISNSTVDEDIAVGMTIGIISVTGGSDVILSITSDPSNKFDLSGNQLITTDTLPDGSYSVTVRATNMAGGLYYEEALPITSNPVDVVTPPPSVPPPVVVITDGPFSVPVTSGNSNGDLKLQGKAGGTGKFIIDMGAPEAGTTYSMLYDPDWSLLSNHGKNVFFGFGFKRVNDFFFIGLKGDGSTGVLAYSIGGAGKFNQIKNFDTVDYGAPSYGTQGGPNFVQLKISNDGTAVTFRTSSDGFTWIDEATDVDIGPIDNVSTVPSFGPAAFIPNNDKGPFTVNLKVWTLADLIPVAPHKYWRIYVTQSASFFGNITVIGDCYFREEAWGDNIDMSSGVTLTASESLAGGSLANMFDGNNTSTFAQWGPGHSLPLWIKANFDTPQSINQVVLVPRTTQAGFMPVDFKIQYSDDNSVWTDFMILNDVDGGWVDENLTVGSFVQGQAFNAGGLAVPDVGAELRRLALYITATASPGSTASFAEIDYRETLGGPDISGGTPGDSSDQAGDVPANARDNNASTNWTSGPAAPPHVYWIDFGGDPGDWKNISQVAIKARATHDGDPTAGKFMGSLDGIVYADIPGWTFSGLSWSDGEVKLFNKP